MVEHITVIFILAYKEEQILIEKGGKNETGRVASLKVYTFTLNKKEKQYMKK